MKCSELMTINPEFCLEVTTVDQIAQLMLKEDVGAIPVVDSLESKKLKGIITDRDLALRVVANGLDSRLTPLHNIMMELPLFSCREDQDVEEAIALMEGAHVRRIPVVDEKQQLVGIISSSDIIAKLDKPSVTLELMESLSCCHVPKTISETAEVPEGLNS